MKNAVLLLFASASLLSAPAWAQAPGAPAAGQRPAGTRTDGAPTGAPGGAPTKAAAPLAIPAPRGNGRISGTVLDGTTKQPVEFATVALLPATGEKPVDGTVADDKGKFVLKGIAPGSYRLSISFIGYGALVQPVTLAEGKMSVDLGSLALASQAKQLEGVTVTGERPIVESKPDRLVYNATQDATNKGGTAADVLRKAPMVSVDPDGNLQLSGSSNVKVLINGKPSAIVANDVAQALKQLPGDQIKSVEVITSPSAKYDGEGSAGIINIVLKENNLQGVNGNVGVAAGTRNSNMNLGLNARKGKVGLSSAINGWSFYSPGVQGVQRVDYTDASKTTVRNTLTQENTGRGFGGGGNGRIGIDYEPAPNHALSFSVNGNMFRNANTADVHQEQTLSSNSRFGNYERELDQKFRVQSYDLTGSYTRTFGQGSRREWTVLGQHTRNANRRFYDIDQYPLGVPHYFTPAYQESSLNKARNLETTLQTDYVHPLSDKQTVEVGGKMIMRNVYSNYTVDTLNAQNIAFPVANLTNIFTYDQNVVAGYATYATSLGKKYSVRLGGRVERTDLGGEFQGQEGRFTTNYTNALPNVALTRNLKQPGSTIRASYSRRIQRPSIFYLNPYRNRIDPTQLQYGNPNLDAEFTDNFELNLNTFVKGSVINISAYSRITNNAIEAKRITRDSLDPQGRAIRLVETTYGNIARNQTYGVNLFGSVKPVPKWDISGNVNLYYVYLRSATLNTSNSGVVYSANINSGYKFDKGYSLQFFGMLNSPRIQLQGKSSSWQMYSIGLRKNLWKDKGDLTLNADNLFSPYIRLTNDFRTATSDQTNSTKVYNRGVRVAFSYRFGKLENKPQRPKRSIRNDDQKAGDGGNGQGN
ncbi:TonB-dependent receptor [Hymenobacter busanensis]|uniref:TonB-dependent receptor n=1 Tax=Hymenobacter busanensis TaxID=2607656 RepID=A0A7L4ZZ66_9BACT|nr:outer membrane beta-barrel family protein [Hymenobacter busanensis]KAA9331657.1 TonB-dependent receptor [Hymenobacter busanensis]QHJ08809.1 TonB-dependent receptor [Hymenobacter busanensis]